VRPAAAKKEEKPAPKKAKKVEENNPWAVMQKADEGKAAPKEEAKAVEAVKIPAEGKKTAQKKKAAPQQAATAKADPNDFMAQMQKAAALNEE
jgi:hypothetical protein